jgi:hypothetical protein
LNIKRLVGLRFGRGSAKKDNVKNEGTSEDIHENKGWGKPSAGPSHDVDENKVVSR